MEWYDKRDPFEIFSIILDVVNSRGFIITSIPKSLAKKRGSKSVISVINNESYSSFANDLGIDVIINPRELTTSRIIEKISKGSLLSYHSILKDEYVIYEIKYKNEIYENIKKSNLFLTIVGYLFVNCHELAAPFFNALNISI